MHTKKWTFILCALSVYDGFLWLNHLFYRESSLDLIYNFKYAQKDISEYIRNNMWVILFH